MENIKNTHTLSEAFILHVCIAKCEPYEWMRIKTTQNIC